MLGRVVGNQLRSRHTHTADLDVEALLRGEMGMAASIAAITLSTARP